VSCIYAGFDKVYVTSLFFDDPLAVRDIVSMVGSQSVGICIPYRRASAADAPSVWDYRSSSLRGDFPLLEAIASAVDLGAGEVLIHDVDRDGSLEGLDIAILPQLEAAAIPIPVLMGGGAGAPSHVSAVLSSSVVQGVVAGSIFSLTQETPATIRFHCEGCGIPMRRP
jgi:cyclase